MLELDRLFTPFILGSGHTESCEFPRHTVDSLRVPKRRGSNTLAVLFPASNLKMPATMSYRIT